MLDKITDPQSEDKAKLSHHHPILKRDSICKLQADVVFRQSNLSCMCNTTNICIFTNENSPFKDILIPLSGML